MARSKTFRKKRKYKHSNNKRTSKKTSKKTYKKRRTMKGGEPLGWLARTARNRVRDLAGPGLERAVGENLHQSLSSGLREALPSNIANEVDNRLKNPEFRNMARNAVKDIGVNVMNTASEIFDIIKRRVAEAEAREKNAQHQVGVEEKDETTNLTLMREKQEHLKAAIASGETVALKKAEAIRLEEEARKEEEEARKEEEELRTGAKASLEKVEAQNKQLVDELHKAVENAKAKAEAARTRKANAIKDRETAKKEAQDLREQLTIEQQNTSQIPQEMQQAIPVGVPFYNPNPTTRGMRYPEASRVST